MFTKFTFVLTTLVALFFMFACTSVSALPVAHPATGAVVPGSLMGRSYYRVNVARGAAAAAAVEARSPSADGEVEARGANADVYIPDEPVSRRDRFARRVELTRRHARSADFGSLH